NERARDSLKKTFEIHDIKRKYAAIIEGNLKEPSGTWTSYLYEDPRLVMHSTYDTQKGRRAVTHFQVEKQGRHFCQLTLTLETGRKNQIRVHCADAGHPVVGDKKYGSKSNPIKRMALHAYFLEFKHPRTGVVKSFSSTIPTAFLRLVS
ncbi:MAG: RNA pseudouridine synthase, partial [Waddliaceae bacterium]